MPNDLARVLCIDDDADILEVAQLSLETVGGLEVTTLLGGARAIETARNCQPDLILLDVMMPGLDGPATLSALQSDDACRDIPVVFMTARVQDAQVAHYLTLGARGVIAKPFDPMTLAEQIVAIWNSAGG